MDDTNTPQGASSQPPAQMPGVSPNPPAPMSAPPAKPKTDVGFLLLGLFAPFVIGGLLGALMSALTSTMTYSETVAPLYGVMSIAINTIIPLLFFAFLGAWMIGRKNGNVRLASFGKGGMWAYAVGALLALLAFGTCVIALGAGGL